MMRAIDILNLATSLKWRFSRFFAGVLRFDRRRSFCIFWLCFFLHLSHRSELYALRIYFFLQSIHLSFLACPHGMVHQHSKPLSRRVFIARSLSFFLTSMLPSLRMNTTAHASMPLCFNAIFA